MAERVHHPAPVLPYTEFPRVTTPSSRSRELSVFEHPEGPSTCLCKSSPLIRTPNPMILNRRTRAPHLRCAVRQLLTPEEVAIAVPEQQEGGQATTLAINPTFEHHITSITSSFEKRYL